MTETSQATWMTPGLCERGGRGEGASQRRGGERSEPPRSGEAPSPRQSLSEPGTLAGAQGFEERDRRPDAETLETPTRRRFPIEYKRRILAEADACDKPGQIGALLRREGLYSSLLSAWRRQRDEAFRQDLASRRRGPKPRRTPQTERADRLERENARLRRELDQAKLIIDIQKKTSQLLGIELTDVSEHERILEGGDNE